MFCRSLLGDKGTQSVAERLVAHTVQFSRLSALTPGVTVTLPSVLGRRTRDTQTDTAVTTISFDSVGSHRLASATLLANAALYESPAMCCALSPFKPFPPVLTPVLFLLFFVYDGGT